MPATFDVTLNPLSGVSGGPQHITLDAHDQTSARRLVESQYGRNYRIAGIRQRGPYRY